jgi:hypothetical protein
MCVRIRELNNLNEVNVGGRRARKLASRFSSMKIYSIKRPWLLLKNF